MKNRKVRGVVCWMRCFVLCGIWQLCQEPGADTGSSFGDNFRRVGSTYAPWHHKRQTGWGEGWMYRWAEAPGRPEGYEAGACLPWCVEVCVCKCVRARGERKEEGCEENKLFCQWCKAHPGGRWDKTARPGAVNNSQVLLVSSWCRCDTAYGVSQFRPIVRSRCCRLVYPFCSVEHLHRPDLWALVPMCRAVRSRRLT